MTKPTPSAGDFIAPSGRTRRWFLGSGAASIGAVLAWPLTEAAPASAQASAASAQASSASAQAVSQSGPAAILTSFNTGWLFGASVPGGSAPGFDDSGLATVSLPHTVTPLSWQAWDPASWEQVWLYRKHFDAPAQAPGMRTFLDFAGAITGSTITVNGTTMPQHLGGYLPFSAELTSLLQPTGNVVAVELDATFNLDVPPDRAAPQASSSVDYWQAGGIYRNVSLRVVPQVYLADVFAKPEQVLDPAARSVDVTCTVDAATVPSGDVELTIDLRDGASVVTSATVPVTISAAGQTVVTATLTGLGGVSLWDLDNPRLYDVVVTLSVAGAAVHDYRVRIGFREASFELDGFFLNGNRVKLFGLNRHQMFPFGADALPDRVQRKDAEIMRRDLNCNMVRCSHYPQSEAFLDACDELGLMVWEEIPGWGYFGDAAWQAAGYQDVHDMIVRDRNHPSIIVWGAMPNEAGEHVAEYTAYKNLAQSLDDSRPTGGDGSRTDASFVFDVFSIHDYSHQTGPDGLQEPNLQAPTDAVGKPYLICEAIGALSGPAKYYRRIDTQVVQQGQATAHARVHNIAASDERYCGVVAWSGYDYESGSGNEFQGVKYTGVIDLFREPKPGAAIYQAQIDPQRRPVIQPAFYWDFGPTSPVSQLSAAMICSNLDRLEVYVGGSHFATVTPDTADYASLPYAPSFVDFTGVDGSSQPELRIDGYLGGSKVASQSYASDPSADSLVAAIDDSALIGDGSDGTRVVFRAVDRYGQPRPYVQGDVTLAVSGPAVLVGDQTFAFGDAGGVGAVWLRTLPNSPGTVALTARHPTLGTARASAVVQMPAPGGPPAPYGTVESAAFLLTTAGSGSPLEVTFTNRGLAALAVTLSVEVPQGWTASATTAASFKGVASGAQVRAGWQVIAPAGTQPGQYELAITAAYTGAGQRGVTRSAVTSTVAYASLAAAFNNTGISDDAAVTAANFDGVGNSYSAQALAVAGLRPGAAVTSGGVSLTWPDVASAEPDNVVAQGQTILVSGTGAVLSLIGAASPSDVSGTGTVFYGDGTTSTFTITMDNYFSPPDTGNAIVAQLPYVNDSNPASNGGTAGQRPQTVYLFGVTVPVTAGAAVQAVALPTGGSNPSSGRVSGIHVFALGIGG